ASPWSAWARPARDPCPAPRRPSPRQRLRPRARASTFSSCSTPFLTGWIPLEGESFDERDGHVEPDAEDAGGEDGRPRRLEVEQGDGVRSEERRVGKVG